MRAAAKTHPSGVLTLVLAAGAGPGCGQAGEDPAADAAEGGVPLDCATEDEEGWAWESPLPLGDTLHDVHGQPGQGAWAVGARGAVVRVVEGKACRVRSGDDRDLQAVWTTPGGHVFVVGDAGAVLHGDGATFGHWPSPSDGDLVDVWAVGPDEIWAVGAGGGLWRFDGAAWSEVDPGGDAGDAVAVWGHAADDVTASLGDRSWRWDGREWTVAWQPPPAGAIVDVWAGPSFTWAVFEVAGGGSSLARYSRSDGWQVELTNDDGGLRAVHGLDDDHVWAVGEGSRFSRLEDGSWYTSTMAGAGYADWFGLWADDSGLVAVGEDGRIARGDGFLFRVADPALRDDLRGVAALEDGTAWAVGDDGVVLSRGLGEWEAVDAGWAGRLNAVWGVSSDDIYVAADEAVLRRDGGDWKVKEYPGETVRAVHGTDFGDVWAVGDDGFAAWKRKGTWGEVVSHTGDDLLGVWIADADDGFVVGGDRGADAGAGIVLVWDGVSLGEAPVPPVPTLQAVWGVSVADVWAVGRAGTILHFDGASWTLAESPVTEDLVAVSGRGPDEGLALGGEGAVLAWDGIAWTLLLDLGRPLRGLAVGADGTWAVGDEGAVIRLEGVR